CLPPTSPQPFPYTTLFRSIWTIAAGSGIRTWFATMRFRICSHKSFSRKRGSIRGVYAKTAPDTRDDGDFRIDGSMDGVVAKPAADRKSTRLNSSHQISSYA